MERKIKTKILDGRELALYIKEKQAKTVRSLKSRGIKPKLVIIRDSNNPVIEKYVSLKKKYGEDIGVEVLDIVADPTLSDIKETILKYAEDASVSGMILQLPLTNTDWTDELVKLIPKEKDVDGLSGLGSFDSATATAINWLIAGYGIDLANKKIAIVGRGRLVGAPLYKILSNSGFSAELFHRGSDFSKLKDFDVIITATGNPKLISIDMVKDGAAVIDAGTASEGGVIVGDISDEIRENAKLSAITPKIGGVGPMTISVLFDNVITAASLE